MGLVYIYLHVVEFYGPVNVGKEIYQTWILWVQVVLTSICFGCAFAFDLFLRSTMNKNCGSESPLFGMAQSDIHLIAVESFTEHNDLPDASWLFAMCAIWDQHQTFSYIDVTHDFRVSKHIQPFFFPVLFYPPQFFEVCGSLETPTKSRRVFCFPWAQTKARTTETILRIDLEVFLTKVDDEKWWKSPPVRAWEHWVFGGRSFTLVRWWCWWWDFGRLCLVMRKKLNWIISSTVRWCFKRIPRGSGGGGDISTVCLINMKASWRLCKIYLIDDHEQRNSAERFYLKMRWFSHTYHTHPYAASGQRDVRFLTDFPFLMEG